MQSYPGGANRIAVTRGGRSKPIWSPDGKRFLMMRRGEGSAPRQLNVILNWPGGAAGGSGEQIEQEDGDATSGLGEIARTRRYA